LESAQVLLADSKIAPELDDLRFQAPLLLPKLSGFREQDDALIGRRAVANNRSLGRRQTFCALLQHRSAFANLPFNTVDRRLKFEELVTHAETLKELSFQIGRTHPLVRRTFLAASATSTKAISA
jgi:hypothetical protein